jgi:hypothetical protein
MSRVIYMLNDINILFRANSWVIEMSCKVDSYRKFLLKKSHPNSYVLEANSRYCLNLLNAYNKFIRML